jgi:hypothetical protein
MIIKELSLSGDQNPIGNDSLPNEKPKKSSPIKEREGGRRERERFWFHLIEHSTYKR